YQVGREMRGEPGHEFRWAGTTDSQSYGCGGETWGQCDGCVCSGVNLGARRQRDGASNDCAMLPECNVDGPVVSRRFAELSGAVERVDDPDTVRAQAVRGVGRLFAQDGVIRVVSVEQSGERCLAGSVAALFERRGG